MLITKPWIHRVTHQKTDMYVSSQNCLFCCVRHVSMGCQKWLKLCWGFYRLSLTVEPTHLKSYTTSSFINFSDWFCRHTLAHLLCFHQTYLLSGQSPCMLMWTSLIFVFAMNHTSLNIQPSQLNPRMQPYSFCCTIKCIVEKFRKENCNQFSLLWHSCT